MFHVSSEDLGIAEHHWRASTSLAAAPTIEWGAPRHVVIVAPHPDDEVLGVGGAMFQLARQGAMLTIVAVTDGEASHPRSSIAPDRLAAIRAEERVAALAALGLTARVVRFGCADGRVARDHGLIDRLARQLADADLCLAPWERDGHPDHDACGRAARTACQMAGVRLVRYPVWAWHWLPPTSDAWPWPQLRRVELHPPARAAKLAAIAAYRSQLVPLSPAPGDEAVLPPEIVARFERPFEVVLV